MKLGGTFLILFLYLFINIIDGYKSQSATIGAYTYDFLARGG